MLQVSLGFLTASKHGEYNHGVQNIMLREKDLQLRDVFFHLTSGFHFSVSSIANITKWKCHTGFQALILGKCNTT